MELHWLLCLVITILLSSSVPCSCDPPNDIYSYKRDYSNNELKGTGINTNNQDQYPPTPYFARYDDGGGQVMSDRRGKYMRLRQEEKQDAKKLRKLKATMKKVLPPLQRLLRDDRDDNRENYTEEDSSGQGMSERRGKYMRLRKQEKQEAKKFKKLKATIKKVLPPLVRLLRDNRDDGRDAGRDNYTEEDSSY